MKRMRAELVSLLIFSAVVPTTGHAATISSVPVDDGYIQRWSGQPLRVDRGTYLFVVEPGPEDGEARGIMEFSLAGLGEPLLSPTRIQIAVNPYGLPLFLPTMRVFGYESLDGRLDEGDWDAGDLIGVWTLPLGLDFREEAFFDVTAFVTGIRSQYVGFRLEGEPNPGLNYASNVFSSLEYYLLPTGPSRLIVDFDVPEPGTLVLLGLGLAGLGLSRRRKA